ncbi:hypothetical protein DOTSEDRAFT_156872 [Lecanosticta acicola]|uniref:Uncharacterized protein n=1 Tax=Lecanosticta acicola TaxID=111012 RepID=A0AAI9E755_9PEZI|nr:hypothetical protein DOTSEDRAFT_156872 [Lecanosticta acicola]
MSHRRSIWQCALLFFTFLSIALAASPTSFCKCTCFSNSTIIPLNDNAASLKSNTFFTSNKTASQTPDKEGQLIDLESETARIVLRDSDPESPKKARTCADCTKKFCLSYNLPICQGADEDEHVFTTCFQRDSTKDQVIIYLFIVATVGLLAWAGVKPWYERWREGRGYARVGG